MNHKQIIFSLLIVFSSFGVAAQEAMGNVKDGAVNYLLRAYATELMPANYGSESAPAAVIYLKDAQQRVVANLYFYATENVMKHQSATRNRDSGLVEDHYDLAFYDLLLKQLKDRSLKHELVYDLSKNEVKIASDPRSTGVNRQKKMTNSHLDVK